MTKSTPPDKRQLPLGNDGELLTTDGQKQKIKPKRRPSRWYHFRRNLLRVVAIALPVAVLTIVAALYLLSSVGVIHLCCHIVGTVGPTVTPAPLLPAFPEPTPAPSMSPTAGPTPAPSGTVALNSAQQLERLIATNTALTVQALKTQMRAEGTLTPIIPDY